MTDSVESSLGVLISVSESLNKASDMLSMRISEVETALQRYNLGVKAWVEVYRERHEHEVDGAPHTYVTYLVRLLGYSKNNGKWGLLSAEYWDENEEETWRQSFLHEAPRDMRIAAIDKLPDLIKKLAHNATELAAEATTKAETARQIAATLVKKSPKSSK